MQIERKPDKSKADSREGQTQVLEFRATPSPSPSPTEKLTKNAKCEKKNGGSRKVERLRVDSFCRPAMTTRTHCPSSGPLAGGAGRGRCREGRERCSNLSSGQGTRACAASGRDEMDWEWEATRTVAFRFWDANWNRESSIACCTDRVRAEGAGAKEEGEGEGEAEGGRSKCNLLLN